MTGKTYTIPQFKAALERMGEKMRGQTLRKAALAGGFVIEANAKVNAQARFDANTGNLMGSINTQVLEESAEQVTVGVGPSVVYGRIQELGGTVRPVSAKHLAVPVNARKNTTPRDYPDLKLIHPKGGDPLLVEPGEGGRVMFVLKKSVTLPARPYLRPAVDEHEKEIIDAIAENLRIEIENSV